MPSKPTIHIRHLSLECRPGDNSLSPSRPLSREAHSFSADESNKASGLEAKKGSQLDPHRLPHPLKSNPNPFFSQRQLHVRVQPYVMETRPVKLYPARPSTASTDPSSIDGEICKCKSAQFGKNRVTQIDEEVFTEAVQREGRRIFQGLHEHYVIEASPDLYTADDEGNPQLLYQKIVNGVLPSGEVLIFVGEAVASDLLSYQSVVNVAKAVMTGFRGTLPVQADTLPAFDSTCSACDCTRPAETRQQQIAEGRKTSQAERPCKCLDAATQGKPAYTDLATTEKVVLNEAQRIFPPTESSHRKERIFRIRSRAYPPTTDQHGSKVPLFQKYCVEVWPEEGRTLFEGDATSDIYASYRSIIAVAKAMPGGYQGSLPVFASQLPMFKDVCSACGGTRRK